MRCVKHDQTSSVGYLFVLLDIAIVDCAGDDNDDNVDPNDDVADAEALFVVNFFFSWSKKVSISKCHVIILGDVSKCCKVVWTSHG